MAVAILAQLPHPARDGNAAIFPVALHRTARGASLPVTFDCPTIAPPELIAVAKLMQFEQPDPPSVPRSSMPPTLVHSIAWYGCCRKPKPEAPTTCPALLIPLA